MPTCSTQSSGEDSNDMDLELFMWCEHEKYIKICLAFFSSTAWLYNQMSIWQPWPRAPVAVCRSISNGDQQLCMKLDDQR
jgi:hypothetical protein